MRKIDLVNSNGAECCDIFDPFNEKVLSWHSSVRLVNFRRRNRKETNVFTIWLHNPIISIVIKGYRYLKIVVHGILFNANQFESFVTEKVEKDLSTQWKLKCLTEN